MKRILIGWMAALSALLCACSAQTVWETVDGGWVQRKNPDFIVKFVAASALNGDTLGELLARDGLRETTAAKNGRALLLCESMTDAPQLQTAAALCLAKAMYPDLFADIDAAQAVGQQVEAEHQQAHDRHLKGMLCVLILKTRPRACSGSPIPRCIWRLRWFCPS